MLGTLVLCFAGVIRTVLVEAAAGMSGRSGIVEPTFSRLSPSVLSGFHEDLPVLNLYSWVERGTVRLKFFAQKHNAMTWPGLEPRPRNTITRSLGNCACVAHIIIRNRHGRFISQDK